MTDVPVNRMLVFAATSVAMLSGFIATALLAIPLRGGSTELSPAASWALFPVPALFAAGAFWVVAGAASRGRGQGAVAVVLAGVGATFLAAGLAELILVVAPLLTAGAAVLATRLLRGA